MEHLIRALTIAGSDNRGGAGVQIDLKTFKALQCRGVSITTAITAEDTVGMQSIHAVPAEYVKKQIAHAIANAKVDAIKIGMLCDAETINVIAQQIKSCRPVKIILDPAIVGNDGTQLLQSNVIEEIKTKLFPLTMLLTPNILEAEILLQRSIGTHEEMEAAAKELCELGPKAVLIKGGHTQDKRNCNDCLYIKEEQQAYWFSAPRVITLNTLGVGCTLSAAITAFLAKSFDLLSAVRHAKDFIYQVIANSDYALD